MFFVKNPFPSTLKQFTALCWSIKWKIAITGDLNVQSFKVYFCEAPYQGMTKYPLKFAIKWHFESRMFLKFKQAETSKWDTSCWRDLEKGKSVIWPFCKSWPESNLCLLPPLQQNIVSQVGKESYNMISHSVTFIELYFSPYLSSFLQAICDCVAVGSRCSILSRLFRVILGLSVCVRVCLCVRPLSVGSALCACATCGNRRVEKHTRAQVRTGCAAPTRGDRCVRRCAFSSLRNENHFVGSGFAWQGVFVCFSIFSCGGVFLSLCSKLYLFSRIAH